MVGISADETTVLSLGDVPPSWVDPWSGAPSVPTDAAPVPAEHISFLPFTSNLCLYNQDG